MFEDSAMKAIFIGAALLVFLTIFSLIVIYYTQAQSQVGNSTATMSIETFYSADIENSLSAYKNDNKLIDGSQIKNMVNYYYESANVVISVDKISLLNGELYNNGARAFNINKCTNSGIEWNEEMYRYVVNSIDPLSRYTMVINDNKETSLIEYNFTLKTN